MEKERALKILEGAIKVAVPVGLIIYGSVWSFSSDTRAQIKEKTGGRCAQCGSMKHIECHHIASTCIGGNDSVRNGIPLCGDKSRDCHEEWDRKTIDRGILYPGIPIEDADPSLFKNRRLYDSAVKKFKRLR